MPTYDHESIEKKWQERWEQDQLYKTPKDSSKPKQYILDMFPYPSGEGLHVGHPKGYIATDVVARMRMMQGYSVLHPMGWDAFGLPAENYALKNKVHPRIAVEKNIATFKSQLKKIGFTYDWDREITTTDPAYYRWTQWCFLEMFKKGLAYESYEPINWCPSCQTGLANEDLEDGRCERCGSNIERKPMRQWVIRITDYAERLLQDLEKLPAWEDSIKDMQRAWIGKSEGTVVRFSIPKLQTHIEVFTTRVDTIFGCTYVVLAPEHPLITNGHLDIKNRADVERYISDVKKKTDLQRTDLAKEKTGVQLEGVSAINPFTDEEVPLYVADYVLGGYGTGAVMAVPAHDARDWEFAKKYHLPIKRVIEPKYYATDGVAPVREGLSIVKRNAVCVVVRNPKDDTYLCMSWKSHHLNGLFTGGIDEGEDSVEAAKRELHEETGYRNVRLAEEPSWIINVFFYHRVKQENRHARFHFVFLELENEERDAVDEGEAALHEAVWKKKEELRDFFTVYEGTFIAKLIEHPDYVHTESGILGNSGNYDGMESREACEKMTQWLVDNSLGSKKINYKIKDWVFSRQRYWGEPIPIIHCEKCGTVAVPEDQLPVTLPEVERYETTGTGESPLANISEWIHTVCPQCGGPGKRETNTMPQWAGSSWYYLRYIDPHTTDTLVDKNKEKYWSPVDLYVGGAEHATRHLIYARFWHKFLYDSGIVNYDEPFTRLQHVGLIMGEDGRKMSKRYGNVLNPDEVIARVGADSLRVYEMFMGPFAQAIAWNTNGLVGARRFLEKVWRLKEKVHGSTPDERLERKLHQTIKKVTHDIEAFHFNTAISSLMILTNECEKSEQIHKKLYEHLLVLLAPFAPHVAEELWESLGNTKSIFLQVWPVYDDTRIHEDTVRLVLQVNGKLRGNVEVAVGLSEKDAQEIACAHDTVKKWIEGKAIERIIVVPNTLVNIVTK